MRAILALAFFASVAATLSAQDSLVTAVTSLTVTVSDEESVIVAESRVQLLRAGAAVREAATTSSTGHVTFTGLVGGATDYQVDVYGPLSSGGEYWGRSARITIPAGANVDHAFTRAEPFVTSVRCEWATVVPAWQRCGTLVRGVPYALSSSGQHVRILFTVRNPSSKARSGKLEATLALSSEDTAHATLSYRHLPARGTKELAFMLPAAYAGLKDNLGRWPARGTEAVGELTFGLRRASLPAGVVAPVDSTVTGEFPFAFTSPCNDSDLLSPVSLPNAPVIGSSGRHVVLIHGYVARLGGGGECDPADPVTYWGLDRPIGSEFSEWPEMVRRLHAEGTRVWLYRWSTNSSMRAAGDELRRRILDSNEIAGEVILLGHSMGGIVGVHALSDGTGLRFSPGASKGVVRLITLGSPHGGSDGSLGDQGLQFSAKEMNNADYRAKRRRKISDWDREITRVAGGSEDIIISNSSAFDLVRPEDPRSRYPASSWFYNSTSCRSSTVRRGQPTWCGYNHGALRLANLGAPRVAPRGGNPRRPGGELADTLLLMLQRPAPTLGLSTTEVTHTDTPPDRPSHRRDPQK